jgi:hypothetical protein
LGQPLHGLPGKTRAGPSIAFPKEPTLARDALPVNLYGLIWASREGALQTFRASLQELRQALVSVLFPALPALRKATGYCESNPPLLRMRDIVSAAHEPLLRPLRTAVCLGRRP